MNDDAHTIEIDRLVLTGVGDVRADRLRALTAAEVQRALMAAGVAADLDTASGGRSVAGEVAGAVVQAVRREAT